MRTNQPRLSCPNRVARQLISWTKSAAAPASARPANAERGTAGGWAECRQLRRTVGNYHSCWKVRPGRRQSDGALTSAFSANYEERSSASGAPCVRSSGHVVPSSPPPTPLCTASSAAHGGRTMRTAARRSAPNSGGRARQAGGPRALHSSRALRRPACPRQRPAVASPHTLAQNRPPRDAPLQAAWS